jgi:hypothetical protein
MCDLKSLISLLLLLSLVEGGATQGKRKRTVYKTSHKDGPVAVEMPNGDQEHFIEAQTRNEKRAILADSEDAATCPRWFVPIHNSTACKCGNALEGIVHCNSKTWKVKTHKCYCMTYSSDNTSLVVGACWYSCQAEKHSGSALYNIPLNVSEVCNPFKRAGQLCGKC